MRKINLGSVITFGRYIQFDNTSALTPIEWIMLETDGITATLISRYGLEIMAYHNECSEVTWKTCKLRTWLNTTFLNEAFTAEEQAQLQPIPEMIPNSPESDEGRGSDTQGKVSLLSIDEVERYFASDEERKCLPTDRALSYHAWFWNQYDGRGNECYWWLRSTGDSPDTAALVTDEGDILYEGWHVNDKDVVVRPVIVMRFT